MCSAAIVYISSAAIEQPVNNSSGVIKQFEYLISRFSSRCQCFQWDVAKRFVMMMSAASGRFVYVFCDASSLPQLNCVPEIFCVFGFLKVVQPECGFSFA